jgi:carbazole 1,9a-dioxygenase terminal dioxygenase component
MREREARRAPVAWQAYRDAVLGFRNHWYPVFFSAALAEGKFKALEILGEKILFKRIEGTVFAIADRCIHRGVPLSVKPESHSLHTISCWYHGFTYDFRDGKLVAVITDPECPMIGREKIRAYPIHEVKGLVFIFIGDGEPPALALDVQPGLLDHDLVLYPEGENVVVNANWRLGAENGIDASHIYIHRNARILDTKEMALPFSSYFANREQMVIDKDGGPKGVVKGSGKKLSVWSSELEGNRIQPRYLPQVNAKVAELTDTSLWLPCGLKVDPFPDKGTAQFEWYVPRNEKSHYYIVTWGKHVANAAETEAFLKNMSSDVRRQIREFNEDDVLAREAMEQYYAEEGGWEQEMLFRPDMVVIEWRKLASRRNRGVQKRDRDSGARTN